MSRKCPYCRKTINKIILKCSCEENKEIVLNARRRFSLKTGTKCRKCKSIIRGVICAQSGCGKDLPRFIWRKSQQNIAILGNTDAGKSHFLAVLFKELRHKTGNRYNIEVDFESLDLAKKFSKDYEDPLYEDMKTLAITPPVRDPEPFFVNITNRKKKKKQVSLLSYDFPGENLLIENIAEEYYYDFIPNAKGIFFLLGNINKISEGTIGQSIDMFQAINRFFGKNKPFIAVIITKYDEFKDLFDNFIANCGNGKNLKISEKTSSEAISKLEQSAMGTLGLPPIQKGVEKEENMKDEIEENMNASRMMVHELSKSKTYLSQLISVIEDNNPKRFSYFTLTALGDAYNKEMVEREHKLVSVPKPKFVEFPIIWMLSKFKTIKY